MKTVVLDGFVLNPGDLSWDKLNSISDLIVYDRTEPRLIVNRISNCEAVLTARTPITKEIIDACPSVRYIGLLSTGTNTVDLEYAREKGIVVSYVPSYSTTSVTQHVFAMLFTITNHIAAHAQSVKDGQWQKCIDFSYWKYPIFEIAGKTMGIIGMGRIGQHVATVAQAFGMKVLGYSPSAQPGKISETLSYVPLDHLMANSDIISIHCPLTDDTQNMIDRNTIAKMKDGVIIINTSRGQIINEWDLSMALSSGKVAFAAVDVLCQEPPKSGSPLIDSQKCIVTPHIAWAPLEARQRLLDVAYENLKAYVDGHPVHLAD